MVLVQSGLLSSRLLFSLHSVVDQQHFLTVSETVDIQDVSSYM